MSWIGIVIVVVCLYLALKGQPLLRPARRISRSAG